MAQKESTVFEIMTRAPICCKVNDPLKDVIYQMAQAEVNALLVVDDENTSRGIISQLDILEHYSGIAQFTAGDVMSRDLIKIQPGETLEEAARLMVQNRVHRLVVSAPERPQIAMGIISASDLIRALVDEENQSYLPVQL